jgi:hypothetical protein
MKILKSRSSGLWHLVVLWWDPTTTQHSVTTWRWRRHGPPKRWYPTTTLHGVTTWRRRQHGPPKRCYPTTTLHGVTTCRQRQKVLPDCWCPTTTLHGVRTQKTAIWIFPYSFSIARAVKATALYLLARFRRQLRSLLRLSVCYLSQSW